MDVNKFRVVDEKILLMRPQFPFLQLRRKYSFMYYFFVNSYFQLYHALDIAFYNEQKVTIITRNIAIKNFCGHINNKVIFYNQSPKYATFKVHKLLKHLIKIRSEAKEFI